VVPRFRPVVDIGSFRPRLCKNPAFILRVKSLSRFRQSENQKRCGSYREKAIKKNDSPHSWLAHVFTQVRRETGKE
jgi:stalled ribosome alternative rescue factor ArfA